MKKSSKPQQWLFCRDRKEWRNWLASNHTVESGVWLQIKKAKSTESGIYLHEAVEQALCYGWIDSKMYSIDSDTYILRMTPRKTGSLWSRINRERAQALIADGQMTGAGMSAIEEARINGRWQTAYTAKEEPAIPADLWAALQTDPVAAENFSNWSNSKKLQFVAWIEESKKPATRARRIHQTVRRAHNNNGS